MKTKLILIAVLLLLSLNTEAEDRIPKAIHQIWIGDQIPAYLNKIRERFIALNPGWEYNIWLTTEQDIDAHLNKTFKQALFHKINPPGFGYFSLS